MSLGSAQRSSVHSLTEEQQQTTKNGVLGYSSSKFCKSYPRVCIIEQICSVSRISSRKHNCLAGSLFLKLYVCVETKARPSAKRGSGYDRLDGIARNCADADVDHTDNG